ncbi:MAG: hypothetical protein R2708_28460 [Vicinamibacterales bacterium]
MTTAGDAGGPRQHVLDGAQGVDQTAAGGGRERLDQVGGPGPRQGVETAELPAAAGGRRQSLRSPVAGVAGLGHQPGPLQLG